MTSRDAQLEAFELEEHELRLRQSRIACILGIVLLPVGICLDAVTYPDDLVTLGFIRLVSASLLALVYGILSLKISVAQIRYVIMLGLLIAVLSIVVMIALMDGASSDYYLGLFLILFAVGLLAPIQTREAALFCAATIALYIAGCVFAAGGSFMSAELFNNLYFLALTCVISITAAHFNYRRRFNEFGLKFKLAAQHEQLETLDRLKSQFFANVSHELRTPLTLILAPVEKIKQDNAVTSESGRKLLDIIEGNALRLLRLVNDILGLIRLEEGRTTLLKRPFNVTNFLNQTASAMRSVAELKSVSLNCRVANNLSILADPEAMEKIVSNILSNAIKFTPAGGRIDIEGKIDADLVVVTITDSGIGIPEEKIQHIFDRFYQVDGSATRRHQGLGLGLAMVRELALRQGGEVKAISVPGDGTKFVLSFPVCLQGLPECPQIAEHDDIQTSDDPMQAFDKKATAREISDASISRPTEIKHNDLTNAPRILIVDDEPDMRSYFASMLRDSYRVLEAADGIQALALAQEIAPDLILLDVMLPGVSGLEVCRTLKADAKTRDSKIIVVTARADEASKITALRHGANDFLIKPFSGLELRTRIENLLRSAQLEGELRRTNTHLSSTIKQLHDTEAALVQNARLSSLGTMAAGLIHEIGNPLNFMGSALQLAARDTLIKNSPDLSETLADIQAGYDRIRLVVTDLRGFTAPQRPENIRPFHIREAVEHALRFTAHARKGITVDLNLADAPPVLGSSSTISQVIVNLIVNGIAAVRAVEAHRTPTITISATAKDDHVFVSVRDNGVGIDPRIQQQIFDPFFSTKEVGDGMGLGLAVCHRIISNHSGSLNVRSCLGEWTEFVFDLPNALSAQLDHKLHVD